MRQKLFEIFSYSIILAVLITTTYTLAMIYLFNGVQVIEPNKLILINEIALTLMGISFTVYKLRQIF
jgi:predicted membrane channel-forming protein YqfA (hemolysin III family)